MLNVENKVSYKMRTEVISNIATKINDKGHKSALNRIKNDLEKRK